VNKIGGREAVRQRIEELARGETDQALDPNQLARTALEAKATDLRLKLDQATRNILEVEHPSLIKALEKRYAEDERELRATEAEIAKLPPPAERLATDIDSEVEAALVLFDEIERLAEILPPSIPKSWATTPTTPAAASRPSGARPFSACPISITCTAICRP
jgi:hypothetical protein